MNKSVIQTKKIKVLIGINKLYYRFKFDQNLFKYLRPISSSFIQLA